MASRWVCLDDEDGHVEAPASDDLEEEVGVAVVTIQSRILGAQTMQTSGYRAWLEQRGLAKSSADTYVSDAKRVERHYGDLDELYPNVAINVVCHAAFSRYFKDLMVGIAVLFNLTCGESEQQSKIDTRSCEIGDLPTIG